MLTIAMLREVFFQPGGVDALGGWLQQARQRGAGLVLLPELPLHPWIGSTQQPRDHDAEPGGGPRHRLLAEAARQAGLGLVACLIVRHESARFNVALAYDGDGRLVGSYRKQHLPCEPGFWETSHYQVGAEPPALITAFGPPIGLQICSDVNRPAGSHVLGAMGAAAILVPRATEAATFERWRLMLRANAIASGAYLLSVPRPRPEDGVPLGGPSIAIAPDGEVLVETEEPLATVPLDPERVARARREYPGYMPVRSDLYSAAWEEVGKSQRLLPNTT